MRRTRVRYWRLKRFLTQKELAEKAGVGEVTISNIERGTPPRISTARSLAKALDVRPEELYTTDDDKEADAPARLKRTA